jgi:hypothetical protein
MSFFLPQNPGIGGINELTDAEEIFLTTLAGLSYSEGDVLTILSGQPSWESPSGSSTWDKPYGDASFTYDVNGDLDTKVVGAITLTYSYDVDGNLSTISDGSNVKTFTYDVNGDLDTIIYS